MKMKLFSALLALLLFCACSGCAFRDPGIPPFQSSYSYYKNYGYNGNGNGQRQESPAEQFYDYVPRDFAILINNPTNGPVWVQHPATKFWVEIADNDYVIFEVKCLPRELIFKNWEGRIFWRARINSSKAYRRKAEVTVLRNPGYYQ